MFKIFLRAPALTFYQRACLRGQGSKLQVVRVRGVCGGADERTVVADAMCSRAAVGVPHGVPLGKRLARTEIACRNQPMRIALDRAAPRGSRGCSRRVDQTAPGDVALNKTEFENAFDHSSLAAGACEGELDAISFSEALG